MFLPKRKLIAFLFLFCLVLFVFFLSTREAVYSFRADFLDFSKIPFLLINGLTHELRAVAFFHKSYWQNIKLTQENDGLKSRLLRNQEILGENARLRKLLDLKTHMTYETMTALVIGKDFNSFRPSLILNKGRVDGIQKYAPVLSPLGLVGKVLEVGRYSSKVILINDPDLSVPALNVRTREQGLVSGSLGGGCKLRFLDIDSDVQKGDIIVTSGLNKTYPEGILIGTVRLVGMESSGLGKFAILEPAVRIAALEEVLVIK